MSQRKYNFVVGEFYHIYNRGTDKRVIFKEVQDYKRFQSLLHIANNKDEINVRNILRETENVFGYKVENRLVSIGAYCLMPNHYHILISPLVENGLSKFMQKLSTSYSMYFNKKYERTGSLFEGKFKSQLATGDKYLKYLFSYIHLNPIKLIQHDWKKVGINNLSRAKEYLEQYNYSSYCEAAGIDREESIILNSHAFPKYFSGIEDAQQEIMEWLSFNSA